MRRSEEARVSEEAVRRKGGGGGPRKLGMTLQQDAEAKFLKEEKEFLAEMLLNQAINAGLRASGGQVMCLTTFEEPQNPAAGVWPNSTEARPVARGLQSKCGGCSSVFVQQKVGSWVLVALKRQ